VGIEGCWGKVERVIDSYLKAGLQVIVQTTATRWNLKKAP
jgi:hypothetical protein